MTQRRSGNEQIKIADKFSGAAQGAAELPETPACFLVDAQDDDAGKEFGEHRFTLGGSLEKCTPSHNSATEIILKASPCARSACRRRAKLGIVGSSLMG